MSSPEKREHYRVAAELGLDMGEAALMRVRSMIAIHEPENESSPSPIGDEPPPWEVDE